jgi:hypothetical protein
MISFDGVGKDVERKPPKAPFKGRSELKAAGG